MHRLVLSVAGAIGLAVASGAAPHAQTATRANWLTDGGDAQRTSWQRHETLISPASVKNMTLLWKLKLDNQPREMHNLFAPLILGDLQVASGAREIAVVAGISDNIYGIDVEKGTQIWSAISTARSTTPGGAEARSVLAGKRPRRSPFRPRLLASTSCMRFRGMGGSAPWIRPPARRSLAPSRFCQPTANPIR